MKADSTQPPGKKWGPESYSCVEMNPANTQMSKKRGSCKKERGPADTSVLATWFTSDFRSTKLQDKKRVQANKCVVVGHGSLEYKHIINMCSQNNFSLGIWERRRKDIIFSKSFADV